MNNPALLCTNKPTGDAQQVSLRSAQFKKGEINEAQYKEAMEAEIRAVVDYQHKVDIDVLVHGEPERNDMVEYFGERLTKFVDYHLVSINPSTIKITQEGRLLSNMIFRELV